MAKNSIYMALGEEAARGVGESAQVGFIPLLGSSIPAQSFDDRRVQEFRGGDSAKGDTRVRRMSRSWSGSVEMPFYTESGGVAGMVGTLLKHFFGSVTSVENGATGQYAHTFYPVSDPFSGANLGASALTLNLNINEGPVMRNWPFVGARVRSLSFEQEAGSPLKLSCDFFGQYRDAATAEIGSPAFAAENLRCDYNNLSVYTGTITRAGTAPDYTDYTFSGATRVRPDKVSVKIENGMEDVLRLSGVDYPDHTRLGQYKVTVEFTVDWEDPASGFSSVTEFNSWAAGTLTTNLALHWDSGTQAGSGDNHGLYIDIPAAQRLGGEPEYGYGKDPMVTFSYEGLYDETTAGYMVALLLKNSVASL